MVKASDLIKEQNKRNELKKKTYKKIYRKVEKKILMASSVNAYYCSYEIPNFILGLPLYSPEDCIKYLKEKLKKDGFKVKDYSQNIIIISWEKSK